jgi:hypothetical protein
MSALPFLFLYALASSLPPQEADAARVGLPSARPTVEPSTRELHTARFRVVHTPRAAAAAQRLAPQLEGLRDELRATIGRDWPETTEVRVAFGREEFEALALGPAPSWAVALAWPEQNVMLVEAHSLVAGEGHHTLRHELVHVALGRLGSGWPRWFQEGLAQSLTGERAYRFSQYETLARAVGAQRIFSLADLTAGFPERPADVEIAYAQSLAFVEFLRERHGPEAFGQLIDEVGRGTHFELALAHAFHTSLSVEEKAFLAELPHRYPWWPLLFGGGTVVWALMAGLVVFAWLRRQRDLAAWHRAQLEVERREDAAYALLVSLSRPANDNSAPAEESHAEDERRVGGPGDNQTGEPSTEQPSVRP